MDYNETALLVGGPRDGASVETYPGQSCVNVSVYHASAPDVKSIVATYYLRRVPDAAGFHRLVGMLADDSRGPMQALYEGYRKGGA